MYIFNRSLLELSFSNKASIFMSISETPDLVTAIPINAINYYSMSCGVHTILITCLVIHIYCTGILYTVLMMHNMHSFLSRIVHSNIVYI